MRSLSVFLVVFYGVGLAAFTALWMLITPHGCTLAEILDDECGSAPARTVYHLHILAAGGTAILAVSALNGYQSWQKKRRMKVFE